MRDKFLVFSAHKIEQPEIDEVVAVLKSGWLGTGPKTRQFEENFAAYKGVSYSAALNSCTAGLHLACIALDLKLGDEIITTPMTFSATINTIIHSGGIPVLADIDPYTLNIDPKEIEKKITPNTRGIIPVHFAGRACDMNAIMAIARKHNLAVIEDCAHAIETEYKGRKAGTFGDFGVFSFYATKNVVTGEGGMVISSSQERINHIKMLSLHGMNFHAWQRFSDTAYKHYRIQAAGFKYNMMDLQAAIGIHQLQRVEKNWLRRQEIWNRYIEAFDKLMIGLPAPIEINSRHAYHLFQLLLDRDKIGISRDSFLNAMAVQKIGLGVHYLSICEYPYYQQKFGWKPTDYPQAFKIGQQTVSLPISSSLTDEDVQDVIDAVKKVLS